MHFLLDFEVSADSGLETKLSKKGNVAIEREISVGLLIFFILSTENFICFAVFGLVDDDIEGNNDYYLLFYKKKLFPIKFYYYYY